jgi:hypothetical protein
MTLQIDRESEIESKFVKACARYGGIARKQTAGGGDLDRRVMWPNGVTTYAEIKKRKGGVRSKAQQDEVGMLLKMGHLAMFVENEMDIAMFIKLSMERVMAQP